MGEKVSQEVRAPFRVMPIRFVSDPTAVSPLFMMLAPIGAAILAFGAWDLIHALPKYSMSVVIMLFGAALLWVGVAHIRARRHRAVPVGYWIGFDSERLLFARHDHIDSRPWTEIGAFRVTESVASELVTKHKGGALDDEVNFVETVSIDLTAKTSDGPPIVVPFEHFVAAEQNRRAGADSFCLFLNDVRHRALHGGLERGAPPFLAPIELNIAPMRQGAASPAREPQAGGVQSTVQRR